MPREFIKDPDAVLDYTFNWDDGYLESGEDLATSTWAADSGITIDNDSETAKTATVVLSGGTPATRYTVTNHITTTLSRTDERSLFIYVEEQ